ncbi:hypothetical protein E1301_Tti022002 [Triplophysa tibetana]|uniref:Uncharacterized protein n=1 Tax=Triplophysa tibetana TaxID=1572043 RepID=A0A5A9P7F0_9TELE|nr:hypothetical protein E1301_Tti022002 [Triplophysa tibetana]
MKGVNGKIGFQRLQIRNVVIEKFSNYWICIVATQRILDHERHILVTPLDSRHIAFNMSFCALDLTLDRKLSQCNQSNLCPLKSY